MPRPRSKETQAALDDIAAGMSQAAAAKKHGVDQGLLSRMLKPKERTVSVKLTSIELRKMYLRADSIELRDKLSCAMNKMEIL